MTIRVLPEALASRIAAGEVIERPASAAKELVENALDAKATRICVTCVAGGKERLVVEDNGGGMSAEELALSVLRHATSKIETLEDLERIETLGFRGEALASLAAVSELEIRSRTRDASQGSMIRIRGNEAEPVLPISSDFGTRIQADHLFYNLPARRKFLKTSLSEFRKCHGVVTNYAIAYPEVEFLLTNEGKTSFHSKAGGDRKKVLECVWGRGDIRSASFEYGSVSVEAWFRPEPERSRMQLLAYVNGRLFFDPVIRAAISRVCHDPSGQWAFFLRLAPENVDVNIHPAKTEVRFLVPGDVFEAVRSSVALLMEPGHSLSIPVPFVTRRVAESGTGAPDRGRASFRSAPAGFGTAIRDVQPLFGRVSTPWTSEEPVADETPHDISEPREDVRFLAQNAEGYLLFEDEAGLVLMDPHAAQERVQYERIRRRLLTANPEQGVLSVVPLPPSLSLEIEENQDSLESLGFSFERKDGELRITRLPSCAELGSPEAALRVALEVVGWRTDACFGDLRDVYWKTCATVACHASLPLGKRLCEAEALALWNDLSGCETPASCPHGRPTTLRISRATISSHFGREK